MTQEEVVLKFLKEIIKNTEWENKVFVVGGCVRDEIMGKKPKDLDFVVNGGLGSGIEFSVWLAKKLYIFKENSNPVVYPRFGTSKLSLSKNQFNLPAIELEFVAPRIETYVSGSRKPSVKNGDLMDETLRRDLTINSLMKNISTDEILDLSGKGIDDIKNKIIRTTSNPEIIFKEDPLRMLRAIRFTVKYGFKISTEVLKNIKKNASLINTISSERISDELNKILLSPNPDRGVRLLKITGILSNIIEEFNETFGMRQNKHHKHDVFRHTVDVLSKTPPDLKTRLIALFHDIGKVATKTTDDKGGVHFYGHENAGVEIAKNVMMRLKYPNELIDAVGIGIKSHMSLKHGEDSSEKISDKTLRKFVSSVGKNLENILDVIHADNISHADESSLPNQINNVRKRLTKLDSQMTETNKKIPINGNDLIQMGLKPSVLFKTILSAVEDAWFENPDLTRDDAMKIVNQIREKENINEISRIIKRIC
jgi:putative nucleotidyltransferase with HDIG domain